MMGPVAEKVLLLENIGTSVKVGPSQLPTLHHLLTEAAAILQMEAPDLYVRQVRFFFSLLDSASSSTGMPTTQLPWCRWRHLTGASAKLACFMFACDSRLSAALAVLPGVAHAGRFALPSLRCVRHSNHPPLPSIPPLIYPEPSAERIHAGDRGAQALHRAAHRAAGLAHTRRSAGGWGRRWVGEEAGGTAGQHNWFASCWRRFGRAA